MFKLQNISGLSKPFYPVFENPTSHDLEFLEEEKYNDVRITIIPDERKWFIQPAKLFHNALLKHLGLPYSRDVNKDKTVLLSGTINNNNITGLESETLNLKDKETLKYLISKSYSFVGLINEDRIKRLIARSGKDLEEEIILTWSALV